MWQQVYDPFHNQWASTGVAAVPVVLLLIMIATGRIRPHIAAPISFVVALLVAAFCFRMPAALALQASALGAMNGLFPIGWIILNVLFLYRLTVERGWFEVIQQSIGRVTEDRRLQLLLVAFCFGAFFEGAAGFGTPVAVTAAILIGLGFSPLSAAGLSLIANTAPVAFGAMGAPIQGLASVTGLDPVLLGQMIGRQVPFFSVLVPFWLIWAFAGFRGMAGIWPAALVCGLTFGGLQFFISNFINPWIVDLVASAVATLVLVLFLKFWRPREIWRSAALIRGDQLIPAPPAPAISAPERKLGFGEVFLASTPWIILCATLAIWATPDIKKALDATFSVNWTIGSLHNMVQRMPPVAVKATAEAAVFKFSILSFTGTGILVASLLSGMMMLISPLKMVRIYFQTLWDLRYSVATIVAMLALGSLSRYSGMDSTLGLAMAKTGLLYPFFGAILGWLGVAATGSDTASNILFGGLQKVTSQQLGISPILMCAANSTGGVMGKMIDTQSIVVASSATNWFGNEGKILRFVFLHSVALACLVGGLVMLQAYVWPFIEMVPK